MTITETTKGEGEKTLTSLLGGLVQYIHLIIQNGHMGTNSLNHLESECLHVGR